MAEEITGSLTLDQLRAAMRAQGARRLFVKFLSPNDNSKNQIYLGGDLSVANVLPTADPTPASSGSHAEPIFKASLSFSWIADDGAAHPAPFSQLILYPQYPEVRFSGFLRGASAAPSGLLSSRTPGRVMILGVCTGARVVGYAAGASSSLARELAESKFDEAAGVLRSLPLEVNQPASAVRLFAELCRIHRLGEISAWRLRADGTRAECRGPNCVGVTLESELGITANGRAEPDFDGWEVKAHSVATLASVTSGTITLLTPEPDCGIYATEGPEQFVRGYGYADKRGRADRLNFGGVHRVNAEHPSTELTLSLDGFDAGSETLTEATGALVLRDRAGRIAAGWSFAKLLSHWQRKHSRAVYVPAMRVSKAPLQYRFGGEVLQCVRTDFVRLLTALADGAVYYDPGIKLESAGGATTTKRRSQFRVRFQDIRRLYEAVTVASVCSHERD